MAISGSKNPFMASVSVTGAAASLYSYLSVQRPDLPHKCCYLQIQLATSAGGVTLSYGNADVVAAGTQCGGTLSAGQLGQIFAFDSNLMDLDNFYVVAGSGTVQLNCTVVVR